MRVAPPVDWTACKGIFVGGCVVRGEGSSFRARAHAHNRRDDPFVGWICVRSRRRVGLTVDCWHPAWDAELVKPSRLLWHEYAHLLAVGHGHDDAWRRAMRDLHQPIPKHYQPKGRVGGIAPSAPDEAGG